MNETQRYDRARELMSGIEQELRHLGRWSEKGVTDEQLDEMGAFGSGTMLFEEWIQFVLLPRLATIIRNREHFPEESMIGAYAVQYFDTDPDGGPLTTMLSELDDLANGQAPDASIPFPPVPPSELIEYQVTEIPPALHTLASLLHQFTGDELENQLQTFDTFLEVLDPDLRPAVADMIANAALQAEDKVAKSRLLEAATSVRHGQRATVPYDHEEAMRKYREEFKKNYPTE